MAELNDWQLAIGAAFLMTALVVGGWLSNREANKSADSESEKLDKSASSSVSVDSSELTQLRQQLEARDSELKEAREEAELILLQLHQVQEELEHYFLESRELQQKLDVMQTITPEKLEQVQRIKARLVQLFKSMPTSRRNAISSQENHELKQLVQRQQNALRRFQHLHSENPTNTTTHSY